jgi:outer membrane protein assembly factor BamB
MLKNTITLISLLCLFSWQIAAQNWTTHCGSNERNGRSELPGPQSIDTPLWTVTDATPTGLGMNIYSFGERFVTSRVSFSPYKAIIECRNLLNGELVWTSPDLGAESILYAMGFNEDAVYAHDYHSSLFYALNASDGSIKWVTDFMSYTFGPMDGVIYTCERDIIINGDLGSVDESTLCLDKETGEVLWTNSNWFAITPNETKAAHGNRLYLITGAINQPKQLAAVDIETGENLYYSEELPGDGDQEGPIAVSPDEIIFFHRDGGDLYAVKDNGSGFTILWTYTPVNMSLFIFNFGVDLNGNLLVLDNGRLFRLNQDNGDKMDSTQVSNLSTGRITIGSDSVVYVNNTSGAYYAFSPDLQTILWSIPNLSGNYYAGPSISKEGIMVVCGAGTSIKAYKFNDVHKPIADFAASQYHIYNGESIDFIDQSSFSPTSWNWEFTGGEPSFSDQQFPQDIYYTEPGIYTVTLIAANEYGSDTLVRQCYIEVEVYTGMEAVLENFVKIFPNPSCQIIKASSAQPAELIIFNSMGEVVYEDRTFKVMRSLDVSYFDSGIYIVKFSNNKFSKSAKLVVGN